PVTNRLSVYVHAHLARSLRAGPLLVVGYDGAQRQHRGLGRTIAAGLAGVSQKLDALLYPAGIRRPAKPGERSQRCAFDFQRLALTAYDRTLDAVHAAVSLLPLSQAVHQFFRIRLVARQIQSVCCQCHHIVVLTGSGGSLERIDLCLQVSRRLSRLQQSPHDVGIRAVLVLNPGMQRATLACKAPLSVLLLEQPGSGGGDHVPVYLPYLGHVGEVEQPKGSKGLMTGVLPEPLVAPVWAPEAEQLLVPSVQFLSRCLDQFRVNASVRKEVLLRHRQRITG